VGVVVMVGRGSVVNRSRFAWIVVEEMVGVEARLQSCVDGEKARRNDSTFLASVLRLPLLLSSVWKLMFHRLIVPIVPNREDVWPHDL
jgi:hypothetical protein